MNQSKADKAFSELSAKLDRNYRKMDDLQNEVNERLDNLTDAVIEGFDNTERSLSNLEGQQVNVLSQ